MHCAHPASCPADCAGQLDVRAKRIGCRFQTAGLFYATYDLLNLDQGTRQPRRQAVRQQGKSLMGFAAIPARDSRIWWRLAGIGAVSAKAATATGMTWAPF